MGLLAGCASFPRAEEEGGTPWLEVSTSHFLLATDMDRRPAEEVATNLENWWNAMTAVVAQEHDLASGDDDDDDDPEPLLVIALRSRWEREAVHYYIGGIFLPFAMAPPVIDIGDIDDDRGRETLRHELAHALLHERLPRVPRWLNEGMAEYLQTAEVDTGAHRLTWGVRSSSFTREYVEFGTSVGIDELLNPEAWTGTNVGAMEFRAGLLVHMLINRHPTELGCYVRALRTEIDVDAPFKRCFSSFDKWRFELGDYGYTTFFKTKTATINPPAPEPRTRSMRDADVHTALALLDIAAAGFENPEFRPPRVERSNQHLRRALVLEPGQLRAGLVVLETGELNARAYADLSAAVVRQHPGDWRAWVARANTPELPDAEQRDAIAHAASLAPGEREVLRLTAAVALSDGNWAAARKIAIEAWLQGASSLSDRAVLAIASAQIGNCGEAQSWAPQLPAGKVAFAKELMKQREGLELPATPCDRASVPASGGTSGSTVTK